MIYHLERQHLHNPHILEQIYGNREHHYYWSDDFSEAMYIDLANAGFISVSTEHEDRLLLLAEIQQAYALLHLEELHIGRTVSRLMRKARYRLAFDTAFDEVMIGIQAGHEQCWMVGKYAELMRRLHTHKHEGFRLMSVELYDEEAGVLVAGEIGYMTANNVYTSLTGFHNQAQHYRSWGTLQLVLLGQHLQSSGVRFWNLGHPYMQYKRDLGARTLARSDFLRLWYDGFAVNPRR